MLSLKKTHRITPRPSKAAFGFHQIHLLGRLFFFKEMWTKIFSISKPNNIWHKGISDNSNKKKRKIKN